MRLAAAGNTLLLGALLGLGTVTAGCRPGGDEGTVSEMTSPEGTTSPVSAGEAGTASVDIDAIRKTVVEISTEIGERVAGTEELTETAHYVEAHLDALGYRPEIIDYELPNGKTGHNVIASAPATRNGRYKSPSL